MDDAAVGHTEHAVGFASVKRHLAGAQPAQFTVSWRHKERQKSGQTEPSRLVGRGRRKASRRALTSIDRAGSTARYRTKVGIGCRNLFECLVHSGHSRSEPTGEPRDSRP